VSFVQDSICVCLCVSGGRESVFCTGQYVVCVFVCLGVQRVSFVQDSIFVCVCVCVSGGRESVFCTGQYVVCVYVSGGTESVFCTRQ